MRNILMFLALILTVFPVAGAAQAPAHKDGSGLAAYDAEALKLLAQHAGRQAPATTYVPAQPAQDPAKANPAPASLPSVTSNPPALAPAPASAATTPAPLSSQPEADEEAPAFHDVAPRDFPAPDPSALLPLPSDGAASLPPDSDFTSAPAPRQAGGSSAWAPETVQFLDANGATVWQTAAPVSDHEAIVVPPEAQLEAVFVRVTRNGPGRLPALRLQAGSWIRRIVAGDQAGKFAIGPAPLSPALELTRASVDAP